MIRNTASQLIAAQLVSATDGSNVTTGTTNVAVEIDGVAGTGGTATHIANGKWEYAPIQADTDAAHITFQFVNSAAVSVLLNVYPTTPQTGDSFARLGAPAGASVSADIADVPTVAEFEARTLAAADYFDPAADTVANVTLVGTTNTNTDMRGTDGANTTTPPTVGAIADQVWDEAQSGHTSVGTMGRQMQLAGAILAETTITGTPTTTTFNLTAGSAVDDFYNDMEVLITSGTLAGLARPVKDYDGATKLITVDEALPGTPSASDGVVIRATHAHPITQIVELVRAEIDSNSTQLAAIISDLSNGTDGLGALKALIDTVNTDLSNGTDGLGALKALLDLINAKTTNLPTDPADQSLIIAATDELKAFIDTEVAAILLDTGTTLPALIGTPADTDIATDIANLVAQLFTTAQSEPTGVPAANLAPMVKLATMFMMARNKKTVTATKKTYFDDGNAAEFEADLSDDGTTYTESEVNAP